MQCSLFIRVGRSSHVRTPSTFKEALTRHLWQAHRAAERYSGRCPRSGAGADRGGASHRGHGRPRQRVARGCSLALTPVYWSGSRRYSRHPECHLGARRRACSRRARCRQGSPWPPKRPGLGTAGEPQQPCKEWRLVNQQLATRRLVHRVRRLEPVGGAIAESPIQTVAAQQMGMALDQLTARIDLGRRG